MYLPPRCINIIVSCLMLHNVCIRDHIPMPDDDDDDDNDLGDDAHNDADMPNDDNAVAEGREVRNRLVVRFAQH